MKAVQPSRLTRVIAPFAPYVIVSLGLFLFRNAWAALIGYHLAMVLIMLLSSGKPDFKQLVVGKRWPVLVVSCVVGTCAGLFLLGGWSLMGLDGKAGEFARSLGLSGATLLAFLIYFVIANPWIEEFYWRGYLGSGDSRPVLNDLMFSGYHLLVMASILGPVWSAALFVVLTVAAWFWRQADRLGGSLLPSLLSHLAADLTVMLVVYARIQGTG